MPQELSGDNVVNFDASSVETGIARVRKAFDDYAGTIINVNRLHVQFSTTGEVVSATIQGMTDSGASLTAGLKNIEGQFQLTSLAAKVLNQTYTENAKTVEESQAKIDHIFAQGEKDRKERQDRQDQEERERRDKNLKAQEAYAQKVIETASKAADLEKHIVLDQQVQITEIMERAEIKRNQEDQQEDIRRATLIEKQKAYFDKTMAAIREAFRLEYEEYRRHQGQIQALLIEGQIAAAKARFNAISQTGPNNYNTEAEAQEAITNIIRTGEQLRTEIIAENTRIREAEQRASADRILGEAISRNQSAANLYRAQQSRITDIFHNAAAERKRLEEEAALNSGRAAQSITLSWQTMVRFFEYHVLYQAFYALIGAMRESIQTAKEFEIRISEIRTISQENQQSFSAWADEVKRLSDEFGRPITEVAEGVYQTLSNQIAKGAETTQFLTQSMKFAATTVATTDQAVNLLSSAINSYHLQAQDAEHVSAVLFKTIELGRVRAEEMANTFGRVGNFAHALGITLEETGAAIDTLTINGIKYNEAFTLINNLMLKLTKPTDELKKLLREWGVETGDAAIKSFGFVGVLRKLQEATHGQSAELADLFRDIRPIRAGIGLLGDAFQDYEKTLNKITTESLPSYQAASKEVFENTGKQVEIELNKAKNYFLESFGKPTLELIVGISHAFGPAGLVGAIQLLERAIITGVTAWIGYRVAIILTTGTLGQAIQSTLMFRLETLAAGNAVSNLSRLGAGLNALRAGLASLLTPVNLLTAGVIAAVIAWQNYEQKVSEAEHAFDTAMGEMSARLEKMHSDFVNKIDEETRAVQKGLEDQFQLRNQHIDAIRGKLNELVDAEKDALARTFDNLKTASEAELSALKSTAAEAENLAKRALDNARQAQKILDQIKNQSENRDYQIDVEFDPNNKAKLAADRIAQLNKEVTDLSSGAADPNKASENLEQVKSKISEITNLLVEQARDHNKLEQERANIANRINELQEKQKNAKTQEVDQSAILLQQEKLRQLIAEKPRKGRAKHEIDAEIAAQRVLIREAQQGRSSDRTSALDTKEAEELQILKDKLTELDRQITTLPDLIALKKQIADLDAKENGELAKFIALQKQQHDQQEQIALADKKNLEEIKQDYKELFELKGEEAKSKEDKSKIIGKADTLEQDIESKGGFGVGNTDAWIKFQEVRKRLAQEADLAIQNNALKTDQETLNKIKDQYVKDRDKVAVETKENQDKIQAGISSLRAHLVELNALKDVIRANFNNQASISDRIITQGTIQRIREQLIRVEAHPTEAGLKDLRDRFSDLQLAISEEAQQTVTGKPTSTYIRQPTDADPKGYHLADAIKDVFKNTQEAIKALRDEPRVQQDQKDLDATLRDINVQMKATGTAATNVTGAIIPFATQLDTTTNELKKLDIAIQAIEAHVANLPSAPHASIAPIVSPYATNYPSSANSTNNSVSFQPGAIQVSLQSTGSAALDGRAIGEALSRAIRSGQVSFDQRLG